MIYKESQMPLVSIIIPVYNTQKYIHECIDSVINQTYKSIEIIIVNDGSTDKSGEICEEYSKHDKRIKVFHISNNGPSSARNIGIDHANGENIMFLDSDDYIDTDMINNMLSEMNENNSDLVINGHKICFEEKDRKIVKVYFNKTTYINRKDFLNDFSKYFMALNIWGKLYRTKIIKENNIRFINNLSLGEDLMFNSKYYNNVNRVSVLNNVHYNYRQVRDSLVHKDIRDRDEMIFIFYNAVKPLLINNDLYNERNKQIVEEVCLNLCLTDNNNYIKPLLNKKGVYNNYNKLIIENNYFDISFRLCIGKICHYITFNRRKKLLNKIYKVSEYMSKEIVIESGKHFRSKSIWERILSTLLRNKMAFLLIITITFKDFLKKIFPQLDNLIL
jgi:glycosyltransferase involved in cell wall biosynthesis